MEALPYFYDAEEYICVHAGVPLDKEGHILPLKDITPEQLVYDRTFKEPHVLPKGEKCVFFGHTTSMSLGYGVQITRFLREGARGTGSPTTIKFISIRARR